MGYKFNDLTGKRFGRLTVIEQNGRDKFRHIIWKCKCDCGNYKDVDSNSLMFGGTKSCGCLHYGVQKDITGQRFGRLVAEECVGKIRGTSYWWRCRCDCGNVISVDGTSLRRYGVKSCGCLTREIVSRRAKTHGKTGTKLYRRWNAMKQRCRNKNDRRYQDYGGRGIKVCEEWNDFEVFEKWALENGYEERLSIDRIDNDGNYCPENCRWVPMSTQAWNKRNTTTITFNGETLDLKSWSQRTGLPTTTIRARIDDGWSIEDALTVPWLERTERKKWKASR